MILLALFSVQAVTVSTTPELARALSHAKPGAIIKLRPGQYAGGQFLNIHGTRQKPILITAEKPADPPVFTSGVQFSSVSYVQIDAISIKGATTNGLNIDDGGSRDKPSKGIALTNLKISDLPKGNHDGIKLSGVDDFRVENCVVERWGGSAIDMVGCHGGAILTNTFRSGGDNGIQTKGGTSEITIRACRFENAGQRGVNIGGSTGLDFFRPPITSMPSTGRYEAKNILVAGCVFVGCVAPVAFVGVDGSTVCFNTMIHPDRWAIRILQETRGQGFMSTRKGVFEDNLIVYRASSWASGGVNIGDGTSPETFRFARNFWFCSDGPTRPPALPTAESGGVYGKDPKLTSNYGVQPGSPAAKVGAHALPPIK